MATSLPVELLTAVRNDWRCRDVQVQQLAALLNPAYSSPTTIVVHGFEATAKSSVVAAVIGAFDIPHAFINCQETISQRHLLHKTLQGCIAALPGASDLKLEQRCEHLNTLAVQLQRLFEKREENFILVLDGIDRQREAGPTLLPSMARLGEIIPNLTVIMIVSSTRPLLLQRPGIPYIHFPPYTRAEAVTIVAQQPPILPEGADNILSDPMVLSKWYTLFTTAVHDSLIAPTSRSLPLLQKTCTKLWPKFIQPILSDEPPPGKSAAWDFSKLFVRNRPLFQISGEETLISRIEASSTLGPTKLTEVLPITTTSLVTTPAPLLKYTTTLLLLAAYLASHTSSKVDILLFSRMSNSSSKSRRVKKHYHRKKLNFSTSGVGTPSKKGKGGDDYDVDVDFEGSPTKKSTSKKAGAGNQTIAGTTKIGKSIWSLQARIPHPFPLDRLFSIYRAIHPQGISQNLARRHNKHLPVADNLMAALVELARLRLVVPVLSGVGGGSSGGTSDSAGTTTGVAASIGVGIGTGDEAAGGGRWRVNVRREFVEERCREWNVGDEGVGAVGEWEI